MWCASGLYFGPLLILIYINDISNVSKVLDFILFAEWCKVNKLSINLKKCNFMMFKPRQKRRTLNISVVLNNHDIKQTKEVVLLGVILDENLSWKPHILKVSRKISSIVIISTLSYLRYHIYVLCTLV